jgi:phage tail sheath protein FI
MAVYLSPGVFPVEIDLSLIPSSTGALTPAFVGTASKGPIQEPTFVSNSQQYIDTFGQPFPESFLGYAVMAYFETGSRAWILRVGVECQQGQPDALSSICIDTSGARQHGWGRIAVFTGIDYGRICTRPISAAAPVSFHAALLSNSNYNDILVDAVLGPSNAALLFTNPTGYTGSIHDSYTVLITSDPTLTAASTITGAAYEVIQNSSGDVVASGELVESATPHKSDNVVIPGEGITFYVQIAANANGNYVPLGNNDSFTFTAQPDNRSFSFSVDHGVAETLQMLQVIYTSADDLATAINALVTAYEVAHPAGPSIPYTALTEPDGTVCLQTDVAGLSIQLLSTEGWALEVGQVLYAFDIPRSFLNSTLMEPYQIVSNNNRIAMQIVSKDSTTVIEFSILVGENITAAAVASSLDLGATYRGDKYWNAYTMVVPGGETQVFMETTVGHEFDQLQMLADTSHYKTLRFAETLVVLYPYLRDYRVFRDERVVLPDAGTITPSSPLTCELDPFSAQCAMDSTYFQNIVGWLVAISPGTWIVPYQVTIGVSRNVGENNGNTAGHFDITIEDQNNLVVDVINNTTFDATDDRYVANVVNPGSKYGGVNGNSYINWIPRPSFLNNDPVGDPTNYEVRVPGALNRKLFVGAADGIPTDPSYSSELDRAIIGNPAEESGLFAFQNPEVYDISLLIIPGASSGAVIGNGLQLCEARGDVLYIVDPPFGLRAQQVVDWHNGMLFSDLAQAINSSYGALYHPWLRIFDQFSGQNIYIPPSGHVSSVYAKTAEVAETWFAPAGLNRGHLLTPNGIEVDLTQGERDLLYGSGNAVNPIVNFPQDGITVWGQRTLQRKQSALDRVNVRMLLIFIKKNAVQFLRQFVFEPNDAITRAQVVNVSNGFLADIMARRGLTAFHVVCDSSNNTPERIDRNELFVSFFLKPTRAIEFIVLNLVILRTDASFSAAEVLAAGGVVSQNA